MTYENRTENKVLLAPELWTKSEYCFVFQKQYSASQTQFITPERIFFTAILDALLMNTIRNTSLGPSMKLMRTKDRKVTFV